VVLPLYRQNPLPRSWRTMSRAPRMSGEDQEYGRACRRVKNLRCVHGRVFVMPRWGVMFVRCKSKSGLVRLWACLGLSF